MKKDYKNARTMMLDNKVIGRNFLIFRKLRDKKAMEIAEHLGMSEAAYTKYERGETKITINIIKKMAEILEVDPFLLMTTTPFDINNDVDSPPYPLENTHSHYEMVDKEIFKTVMKVLEDTVAINKKLMEYLNDKDDNEKERP